MPPIGPTSSLAESTFTSFDGDVLPYAKWLPPGEPTLVVIGLHGIAGAAGDLSTLAEYLLTHFPGAALYAPEVRGQGSDPNRRRRGDIRHRSEWFDDLHTFTRLVRKRHPGAAIVWCGESMGSLIALHAAAGASPDEPVCEALILASTIARIRDDLPRWRRVLLRWASFFLPRLKLSLERLSGEEETRVTKDSVHQEQAQSNPYHVSEFSLRLLNTLAHMIEEMPSRAAAIHVPVLLLHGGHDIFSRAEDIEAFEAAFTHSPRVDRRFYEESYHLLFYDHEWERVVADVTAWLRDLPHA